jgi:hypothetical protein
MKITIESTDKIVEFVIGKASWNARLWEGHTESGTPVHCYVTRICPTIPEPLPAEIAEAFSRELREMKPPSPALEAIPMRMIL